MVGDDDVDEQKRATLRRFAAVGTLSPFTGVVEANEDSDAYDAIIGYVATTPGAHFSKIRDDLQLGTGETQYHLRELERAGAVESFKDGDYKRFYPADQFSDFEQSALGYLRRDTPRGMIIALLKDPDTTAGSLASALGVSRPTISKYAGQLEGAGLLSRDDGYVLERPETLLTLLVRYADSFDDDATDLAANAEQLIQYDP
jgi:predicted transcriptional regulator